jgi:hypothetical protein
VPGYIFPISGSSVAFLICPNPLPPVRALIQAGESHPLPPSPYGEGGRGKGLGVRTRYAFTDRRERKKRIPIQDTSQPSMDPESYLARFFLIHSHGRTFSWSHLSKITPSKKNWVENHPWNSLFREFYPAFACPRPKSLPSRLPSRSGGPGAGCKYPAACPALLFINRRVRGRLRSSLGLRSLIPRGLPRVSSFWTAVWKTHFSPFQTAPKGNWIADFVIVGFRG